MVARLDTQNTDFARLHEFRDLYIKVRFETINDRRVQILKFEGKITNSNSYELNRKIHRLFDNEILFLILDLSDLQYMNSTGMAILFSIAFRADGNEGRVVIGGVHSFLRNVFNLMELPTSLTVYDSLEEARVAFQA